MYVEGLSAKTQDYLKVIQDLHKRTGEKVALSDAAERMGEKKPTASGAVKRLTARDSVNHESYRGASLSGRGRDIALIMVRRHQLIESFLVSTLGCTWDEVHEEAERFEHVVLEELTNHADAILGFPERDSHGNPTPSTSGIIANAVRINLTDIEAGMTMVVDRINDSDSELPRYLATSGVGPGTVLRAEAVPYADVHVFIILSEMGDTEPKKIHVADSALWAIRATPTTN